MTKNLKATLGALLGYSIFGFSFLFSKTALDFASPFFLLGVRFLLAFLALNLVLLFGKAKSLLKENRLEAFCFLALSSRFVILSLKPTG
ncbi:MAG: EamA family transporter [Oscillospiraceae bacterium]|nr:EamA family transporter [Oscillospiraceae bacterium]